MSDAKVLTGDCIEVMATLEEASIDAVVCDPPYGIGFMGHEWDQPGAARADRRKESAPNFRERKGDHQQTRERSASMHAGEYDLSLSANQRYQAWCEAWAREAFRVLKPGGHLLAMCGTRTYHRLAAGIEDAGFEIRDSVMWMYGSGFPKSLDVSKAIDKAAGAEREVIGQRTDGRYAHGFSEEAKKAMGKVVADANESGFSGEMGQITAPATPEAAEWEGWGTALKPAHEPIVVARKPLIGTVAQNVLEHGTGGINIDGCRIGTEGGRSVHAEGGEDARGGDSTNAYGDGLNGSASAPLVPGLGRWPSNVVLSEEAAEELDAQTGELVSGPESDKGHRRNADREAQRNAYGGFQGQEVTGVLYGDRGGASRFFYCAKTSCAERNAGLDGFASKPLNWSSGDQSPGTFQAEGTEKEARNHHPTVKPIELMRWLVRLVTPPDGVVLDPFLGSGTTGCAAVLEDFDFIGVEREAEYVEIAEARIAFWTKHRGREIGDVLSSAAESRRETMKHEEAGQLGLGIA